MIAQLASRLYNESPGGHGSTGLGQAANSPVDPAADSMFREHLQAPSVPVPTDWPGFERSRVERANSRPVCRSCPRDGFRVPTESWGFSDAIPASPVPQPQTDGLRAFVQNIRRSDFRSATEAFPGEKPDSTAYANRGPARSQTSQPSFDDRSAFTREGHASGFGARPLDVDAVRQDFPILHQRVHGRPLVWLDNAATTQKPQSVIDALSHFYEHDNSNIHRGAHTLASRATEAFEQARDKVRDFLGASSSKEIVFVRGTTEAINLVAQTWGRKFLQPGDEIILSTLEHHANIVPWQLDLERNRSPTANHSRE